MAMATKHANKTISLSSEHMSMCLEVSAAWNKTRDSLDKQANWADAVRHGITLVHAEYKKKKGKSDPRQLELLAPRRAKKKAMKKKVAKKAPKRAAKKVTKRKGK